MIKLDENKETPRRLNILAREEMKLKLLADIRIDLQICEIEGWDKKEYLLELFNLLKDITKTLNKE
jgi:hypothetical protein